MDNKNTIIIIGIMLIMSSMVSGFAITKSHSTNSPLIIMPGEKGEAWIEIQNMIGTEEVKAEITITEGQEIISNEEEIEKEIKIKTGERKKVIIELEMPSDAELGRTMEVELTIMMKNENEGLLTFNSEITQRITIMTGKPAAEVENIPVHYEQQEKPLRKNYDKLLVATTAIIAVLIVVKVMIMINRRK